MTTILAQEVNRFSNPYQLKKRLRVLAVAVSSIIARDLFLENSKIWDVRIGAVNFKWGLERLLIRWQSQIFASLWYAGPTSVPNRNFKIPEKAKRLER